MTLNALLWIVQVLLALLFLFSGTMKLILPVEAMAGPIGLPGPFLRFLGIAEVCGALGLILPGVLRVYTELTALAGLGLVLIMTGATLLTAATGDVGSAVLPLIAGVLAAFVAYARSYLAPLHPSRVLRWTRELQDDHVEIRAAAERPSAQAPRAGAY
jgi:hypothetical protein